MIGRWRLQGKPEIPSQPGWRDYFQIVTTILMGILGFYILWQALFVRWALPSLIFSVSLLLFVVYRVRMYVLYFQQKGKRHDV